jgi:hypothetical protein
MILRPDQKKVFESLMSDEEAKRKGLPYKEKYINEYGVEDYRLYNTDKFSPAADIKRSKGYYIDANKNTAEWEDFWLQELERCLYGYSCGSLRVTGYHYNMLNYTNIEITKGGSEDGEGRATARKMSDFPRFIKAQYDYFWCIEVAEYGINKKHLKQLGMTIRINDDCLGGGLHVVVLKSRQIGWSVIASSMAGRDFAMCLAAGEKRKTFIAAGDSKYLTAADGIMTKVKSILSYYNHETNKLFYQPLANNNKEEMISGTENPHTREIEYSGGIIASRLLKNIEAARGINGYKIYLEEFGSFRDSNAVLSVIRPSVEPGGYVTGNIIAFGTGGEQGPGIEGLEELFYNPKKRNFLRVDNSHYEDDLESTGIFIPIQEAAFRFLDEWGNPKRKEALEYFEGRLEAFKEDPEEYQRELAEMPFKPTQAFRRINTNRFDTEKLIMRQEQLKANPVRVMVGDLEYIMDGQKVAGISFKENRHGKIKIVEPPIAIGDSIPNNMYIAGIDGIDMGKDIAATSTEGSDFCMVIKKRYSPLAKEGTSDKYVAWYMDRPNDETEAFEIALKLAVWYNCEINLEKTRIGVRNHFRANKTLGDQSFRFCAPPAGLSTNLGLEVNSKSFGTQATAKTNEYSDNLVKHYIKENCHLIDFPEFIDQALKYDYAKRSKFDLIVAWGMTEILDESYMLEGKQVITKVEKNYQKYGFYTDRRGVRRFGIIGEDQNDPLGLASLSRQQSNNGLKKGYY